MRPGLSQGADCLPVSLLLLRSSSQAQVCVGSARVLSDDSNSCCVLALSHTKRNTQLYIHSFWPPTLTRHISQMDCFLCVSKLPSHDIHRRRIYTSASLFSSSVWKYIRPHAVCSALWQRARENKAVEIVCCLTTLPYGHWIHSRPATTHRIDRNKTTAALNTKYDCISAASSEAVSD